MELLMFFIFAALAIIGAFLTILSPKAVNSAMSLILVMISLAGIYLLLNAHFIAVLQIIVYAGAIMTLILFVIMLLPEDEKTKQPDKKKILTQLAILTGAVIVFLTLTFSLTRDVVPDSAGMISISESKLADDVKQELRSKNQNVNKKAPQEFSNEQITTLRKYLLHQQKILDPEFGTVREVGRLLFTQYALAFEIISLVLLTALVATLFLAKRRLNP